MRLYNEKSNPNAKKQSFNSCAFAAKVPFSHQKISPDISHFFETANNCFQEFFYICCHHHMSSRKSCMILNILIKLIKLAQKNLADIV